MMESEKGCAIRFDEIKEIEVENPLQIDEGQRIKGIVCGHKFHELCIDTWIHTVWSCPVCRHKV